MILPFPFEGRGGSGRLCHTNVALLFILVKVAEAIVFRPAAQQTCLRLNTPIPDITTPQKPTVLRGIAQALPRSCATHKSCQERRVLRGTAQALLRFRAAHQPCLRLRGGLPSQTGFVTGSPHQHAAAVPTVVCVGIHSLFQLEPSGERLSPSILVTMQQVCPKRRRPRP